MRNLTPQFRQALYNDERNYIAFADIALHNQYRKTADTSIDNNKTYYTRATVSGEYVYTAVTYPSSSSLSSYYEQIVLNLSNSEIWFNGFGYEDAVSEDDNFTAIGSVVIGAFDVIINNIDETYSEYDFTDAEIVAHIGMQFDNLDKYRIGTYTVEDTAYNGATIKLSALDNMAKFDKPYSLSSLTYPNTLYNIVLDLCTICGVQLKGSSSSFPQYNYTIATGPADRTSVTCREVLSWCVAVAGCFAKCDADGKLEIKWFNQTLLESYAAELDGGTFDPWTTGDTYDGGTFSPWTEGDSYDGGAFTDERGIHYIYALYSQNICMDDVVITGFSLTVKSNDASAQQIATQYTAGSSGYMIDLGECPFFTTTNAQEILNSLQSRIGGLRFRKMNISIASDPSIEAGDIAVVIDRKQNIYRALITRTSFSINGAQTVVCGASTPARNKATRFSSLTKSLIDARQMVQKEKSDRESAVSALATQLANNTGVYTTIETVTGGGKIYYLHDKPNLTDSKMVWKMTASSWAVTDDWQGTDAATASANKWNAGMTVDGTFIASVINTISAFFDNAHGGTLTLGGYNNTEGQLAIKNNSNVEIGRWSKDGISLNNGKFSVDANGNLTSMNITAYGSLICYESYTIS